MAALFYFNFNGTFHFLLISIGGCCICLFNISVFLETKTSLLCFVSFLPAVSFLFCHRPFRYHTPTGRRFAWSWFPLYFYVDGVAFRLLFHNGTGDPLMHFLRFLHQHTRRYGGLLYLLLPPGGFPSGFSALHNCRHGLFITLHTTHRKGSIVIYEDYSSCLNPSFFYGSLYYCSFKVTGKALANIFSRNNYLSISFTF